MKYCTIDNIPSEISEVLVLGAKIGESHKLSPILKLRMFVVSQIADRRKDITIHLSGCCEDTSLMYKSLVEEFNIDESRIIIDFTGFTTWDAIDNMTRRDGYKHFLILTSSFHIKRAMVIAKWMKAEAIAFDISGYEKNKKNYYATREKFAFVKAAILMMMDVCGLHLAIKHLLNLSFAISRWIKLNLIIRPSLPLDIKFTENVLNSFNGDISSPNAIFYLANKLKQSHHIDLSRLSDEELIVRPRYIDCTTFIEYIFSFQYLISKHLHRYSDFCDSVRKIRYKDGNVDFLSRNHYFSWMIESMVKEGLVHEVDVSSFGRRQILHLSFMSDHPYLYRQFITNPHWIQIIKARELEYEGREYAYIPVEFLNKSNLSKLKIIHDGDILCIVVNPHSWARGLDIKHLLIARWKEDGLYFLHSSSLGPVESEVDLFTYLKGKYTMAGIRVLRPIICDLKN